MLSQLEYLGIGLVNIFDPLNFGMILIGLTIGVLAGLFRVSPCSMPLSWYCPLPT